MKKPRRKLSPDETNPFNHPFPHAKLRNVKLTPLSRLSRPYSDDFRQMAFGKATRIINAPDR